MMGYGYPRMHYGGFMMIPSILCTLIFTILIIYFLVRIIKHGKFHGHDFHGTSFGLTDSTTKALEVLNIRYASGEVSDEEYNTKKEQILKKIN